MKPSELYEALHALISERVPLHIWGACGVGKSQIVAQVAADRKCEFLDIRAVQLDPVDLRGLPRISADRAEWVPPKFFPLDGEGILFLDELTSAPQMTQAGCYQLVLDRKLGEYRLPDGWLVIAAGNPASAATCRTNHRYERQYLPHRSALVSRIPLALPRPAAGHGLGDDCKIGGCI
jgi:MoxR-like ATPase